jgi:hypothetical protein
MKTSLQSSLQTRPWYRYGMVWFLLAGPIMVIVAGVATAYIAMSAPDPVLANDAHEFGQSQQAQDPRSLLPAQKARNHAATPEDVPIR